MTVLTILLIFVTVFNYSKSSDCILNVIPREDAWDKVLHKDIFKFANIYSPPNETCVPVTIIFQLKSFIFDEYEGQFTAKVWSRMKWRDSRLSWNPDDYGGLEKVVVRARKIWTPVLKLLEEIENDVFSFRSKECIVNNTGSVLCVPPLVFTSSCKAKLSNWPYDSHNCTLEFGDGRRYRTTNYTLLYVSLDNAEYGAGWNIRDIDISNNVSSKSQVSVTFTIHRQAYGLATILIVPSILVSLLTASSSLLSAGDYVRLHFLCFSLISHFILIRHISLYVPTHSVYTPTILLFVRGSLILTLTSVIFTYFLSVTVKRKTVPFKWMNLLSVKVFDSFGRYLIFPRWIVNTGSGDENVKNKEVWTNFANILNSVYLFIVVVVYIGIYLAYMPVPPPLD